MRTTSKHHSRSLILASANLINVSFTYFFVILPSCTIMKYLDHLPFYLFSMLHASESLYRPCLTVIIWYLASIFLTQDHSWYYRNNLVVHYNLALFLHNHINSTMCIVPPPQLFIELYSLLNVLYRTYRCTACKDKHKFCQECSEWWKLLVEPYCNI